MNGIEHMATEALAWLWQTSLAATLLIVLVVAIQLLFGRVLTPRWTYTLWLLVALRLVLPLAPESRVSILGPRPSRHELPRVTVSHTVNSSGDLAVSSRAVVQEQQPRSLKTVVATLWLFGALAYLLCCLAQYRRLSVWARRQPVITAATAVAALEKAQAIVEYRRVVRMIATQTLPAPSVLGVRSPALLLPKSMLETWTQRELELVLLHELAHVRRRDNLLNWCLICAQALHWFNPLVWFAFRKLRAEREALCDAIVLSHLEAQDHESYGAALIKAAQHVVNYRFAPAITPIINHKSEIQRRIRMISRFKPTSRLVTVFAAVLVVAIACVTFTRAAQKKEGLSKPTEVPQDDNIKRQEHGIKVLEEEFARIDRQIREREEMLEKIRREMEIPSYLAQGDGSQPGPETETIRKLQALRLDAVAEHQQIASLYEHLTKIPRNELRKAIQTACPDQQLSTLVDRLADAEQKIASMTQIHSLEHPDVAAVKAGLDRVNRQIDERLEGVLAGLKIKTASSQARVAHLDKELEQRKRLDLEAPSRYRPYFTMKRELETLLAVRERLHVRIIQEKVDRAIPPKPAPRLRVFDSEPATP